MHVTLVSQCIFLVSFCLCPAIAEEGSRPTWCPYSALCAAAAARRRAAPATPLLVVLPPPLPLPWVRPLPGPGVACACEGISVCPSPADTDTLWQHVRIDNSESNSPQGSSLESRWPATQPGQTPAAPHEFECCDVCRQCTCISVPSTGTGIRVMMASYLLEALHVVAQDEE